MYNRITLIGSISTDPQVLYEPSGACALQFDLCVPPPADAPFTYWSLVYDLRDATGAFGSGDDTFLIICRESHLIEECMQLLHKGDLVCVEGRLVLTLLRSNNDLVPLAEILANNVVQLQERAGEEKNT